MNLIEIEVNETVPCPACGDTVLKGDLMTWHNPTETAVCDEICAEEWSCEN